MIRNLLNKAFAMTALVAALVLLPSAKAEATFSAWICDTQSCSGTSGVNFVTANDNTGLDTNAATGVITLSGATIGGMTANITSSFSTPVFPQPGMDMSFSAISTTGGDVWFYATDTDFSVIANLLAGISATFSTIAPLGTPLGTGTVEAFVYGGGSNSQFPLSPQLGTSGVLSSSGILATPTSTFPSGIPSANPYSYTLALHIVSTGFMSTTGNFAVTGTPIPEPATLSLLGLGLTGIGAAFRRRRRKARQNA